MDRDEERVVQYSTTEGALDAVTDLSRKVNLGEVKLDYDEAKGYLPALLKVLKVPVSSQTLVFSKTSSQAPFTSPATPRAIYYNDKVFVGWAQGSPQIDLAAIDPKKGVVFFTLDQDRKDQIFKRNNNCVNCHIGPKTLNVPGLVLRSVYTEPNGRPTGMVEDFISGHNSVMLKRWGGWYVTGTHGDTMHLGNKFLKEAEHEKVDLSKSSNLTTLDGQFDTSKYLSSHSDSVSLMVLDHLVRMQIYLTKARYETLLAQDTRVQHPKDAKFLAWADERIKNAGEDLLAYMLFRDEAKFKGPFVGTTTFAKEFSAQGPRDRKGRSLRDFDLNSRVFKYPCSYLIYGEQFEYLPAEMKNYLYRRLDEVLTGKDRSGMFKEMRDEDRKAVLEILTDTKPDFAQWRKLNR